jgi:hypothetical protein
MAKKLGWFTAGGFEKDPKLTKADKNYYRKNLLTYSKEERKKWEDRDSRYDLKK